MNQSCQYCCKDYHLSKYLCLCIWLFCIDFLQTIWKLTRGFPSSKMNKCFVDYFTRVIISRSGQIVMYHAQYFGCIILLSCLIEPKLDTWSRINWKHCFFFYLIRRMTFIVNVFPSMFMQWDFSSFRQLQYPNIVRLSKVRCLSKNSFHVSDIVGWMCSVKYAERIECFDRNS